MKEEKKRCFWVAQSELSVYLSAHYYSLKAVGVRTYSSVTDG